MLFVALHYTTPTYLDNMIAHPQIAEAVAMPRYAIAAFDIYESVTTTRLSYTSLSFPCPKSQILLRLYAVEANGYHITPNTHITQCQGLRPYG